MSRDQELAFADYFAAREERRACLDGLEAALAAFGKTLQEVQDAAAGLTEKE